MLSIGDLPLGRRLTKAAVAVTLLLGTIEVIQIRVSGRVIESTDCLLALVLALTLGPTE
jgi:hypothetical protein